MASDGEEVHPTAVHSMRVSYAMWRAFRAAMDKAMKEDASFDDVPTEMLRLLRLWGIEVVELPAHPQMPGPPSHAEWPEDEDEDDEALDTTTQITP